MRTAVTVNDNAPPQWRGRTGWITEDRPGGFHLVELKGGGQVLLHRSEVDRQEPAEPETITVMVGHCAVAVPASVAAAKP